MKNQSTYVMGSIGLLFVVGYLLFAPETQPDDLTNMQNIQISASPTSLPTIDVSIEPSPKTAIEDIPTDPLFKAGQKVWLRSNNIRLRQKPSLIGKIIRESSLGESYYLTGRHQESEHIEWLEIELNPGQTAWISKDFLLSEAPDIKKESQVETAKPPVLNLHQQSVPAWSKASESVKNQVSFALAEKILKKSRLPFSPQQALELKICLDASAQAPDLQTLKIYELTSTCAIALNWI